MTKLKIILLLGIFGILMMSATNQASAHSVKCVVPTVAGHRGDFAHYTQSTEQSFNAAYREGAHVWETDVRFTKTDVPVLLHDPDLRAFYSGKQIADISLHAAKQYRSAFGAHIETLWEFAQQVRSREDVTALVELKTVPTAHQWKMLDVRFREMGKQVYVASFDMATVRIAESHHFQTAPIDANIHRRAQQVRNLGTSYEKELSYLSAAAANALRAHGVTVYAWTADTKAEWRRALALHVVPLTNNPGGFVAWYKQTHC